MTYAPPTWPALFKAIAGTLRADSGLYQIITLLMFCQYLRTNFRMPVHAVYKNAAEFGSSCKPPSPAFHIKTCHAAVWKRTKLLNIFVCSIMLVVGVLLSLRGLLEIILAVPSKARAYGGLAFSRSFYYLELFSFSSNQSVILPLPGKCALFKNSVRALCPCLVPYTKEKPAKELPVFLLFRLGFRKFLINKPTGVLFFPFFSFL